MDGHDFPSDFRFLQSSPQAIGDCSQPTNYNWFHRHPWVPHFFKKILRQDLYYLSILLFLLFYFQSVIYLDDKIHQITSYTFSC